MAASNPYAPGFVQLSPTVFYHAAPDDETVPSRAIVTRGPNLILITSWMNALPRHVRKHITALQRLFPSARVLLITTSTSHFLIQPESRRIKQLDPALDILQSLQPQERVLLHAYSNGGAAAAFLIAKTHHARTGQPLPISKAVFDSAPGTQRYSSAVAAFSAGLPKNPISRAIGTALLQILLGIWYCYLSITRSQTILDRLREGLNDPELFPTDAARLYVYSMADQLIQWQDVEAHAKEAGTRGYSIHMLKYLDTAHIAHMLSDGKRYWTAVTELWDMSDQASPESAVVTD